MGRRELREHIFKMLFRIEFHKPEEMPEQFQIYTDDLDITESDNYEYIRRKYDDVIDKLEDIDAAINEITEGWKTSRMGKVDLAIIRLAVYEIKYDEDVPTGVAINEAVEIAKQFGGNESPVFINGILAKFVA